MPDPRAALLETTFRVLWAVYTLAIFLGLAVAYAHEHGWYLIIGAAVSAVLGAGAALITVGLIETRAR